MVAEIDLSKYRWAAVKGGRQALRMYGKNSSLSNDDADGESSIALSLCQRTFDAEKGRFGCYVKRAAFNAVRRLCQKHLQEPIAEIPEGVASASGDFEEWLGEDTSRVKVLANYSTQTRRLPFSSGLAVCGSQSRRLPPRSKSASARRADCANRRGYRLCRLGGSGSRCLGR